MATNTDAMRRRQAAMAARRSASAPQVEEPDEPEALDEESTVMDIKPRGNNASGSSIPLAVHQPVIDRSREITASDLVMPKILLAQGLSKVVQSGQVKLGHWYHSTNAEDLGTEIRVIPVDMWKSRSRFENGVGVICRSYDFVQGEGNPGILCEGDEHERYTLPERERGCELRLWGERDPATGRSKPPACGVNYNFPMIVLVDPDDPINGRTLRGMLTLRSTQSAVAKTMISMVTEGGYNWTDVIIRLGVVSRTNARGQTYYNSTAELLGRSEGKALERAEQFAATVNASNRRSIMERDETVEE